MALQKIKIIAEPEINSFIAEAERLIQKYGWQDKTVHPYRFPVKVVDMIDRLKDLWSYTRSSREIIVAEANGLVEIFAAWEEYENKPKVKVRVLKTGKVVCLLEEDLDLFGNEVEVIAC